MNKARELKKKYGGQYLFRKYLTGRQIAELKAAPPDPFPDTAAASLEVGCVPDGRHAVPFSGRAGTGA